MCMICIYTYIYTSATIASHILQIILMQTVLYVYVVVTDDSNRIKVVSYEDSGSDYVNASPIDVCYYHVMKCYIETVSLGL